MEGRRDLLKSIGALGAAGALTTIPATASGSTSSSGGCYGSDGNYSSTDWTVASPEFEDNFESRCDSGFNSGTGMEASNSLVYITSEERWNGEWEHWFRGAGHAQHYNENDCDWELGPGIDWHEWRMNEHLEHNTLNRLLDEDNKQGAYPPTGSDGVDDNLTDNRGYTVIERGISFWIGRQPVTAKASTIANAVHHLYDKESSSWDHDLTWSYSSGYHTCADHFNIFKFVDSENNEEDLEVEVNSQSIFANQYFSVVLSNYLHLEDNDLDTDSQSDDVWAQSDEYEVGETIELNDRKAIITSKNTSPTEHFEGGGEVDANEVGFEGDESTEKFYSLGGAKRSITYVARHI